MFDVNYDSYGAFREDYGIAGCTLTQVERHKIRLLWAFD